MKNQISLASLVVTSAAASAAASNILPLPPMGFNNWARFMTGINESIFVDAANAMSCNGLLEAGYNRLHLDDAWSTKSRAANGSMVWDPVKFPNGLPWLTQFMKDKGFIPGIYTDSGTLSCGGYPGALGHEEQDLETFLDWGFEYLKMDGCNLPSSNDAEAEYYTVYTKWHDILTASPRPMIFSDSAPAYFSGVDNLTDWYRVMGWAAEYGQLARHSADIETYPSGPAWDSIMYNYGQEVRLARYQKPGYINDPDFLITDNPTLSLDEKKSHFALWCSFSAPLLLSVNTPTLTDEELAILTNRHLIAVNQDRLLQQATLVSQDDTWDVLTRSLENGDRLLTVLNRGNVTGSLAVYWDSLGLQISGGPRNAPFLAVTDLWTGEVQQVNVNAEGIVASQVPAHGTAVFRISLDNINSPVIPTGLIFNTASLLCLTDADYTDNPRQVTWATCNASFAQTWAVRPDGHISSLKAPTNCLVDVNGEILTTQEACYSDSDTWTYHISGNLINNRLGNCLTEATDDTAAAATATACGDELDSQVVGLPAGVNVNEN